MAKEKQQILTSEKLKNIKVLSNLHETEKIQV